LLNTTVCAALHGQGGVSGGGDAAVNAAFSLSTLRFVWLPVWKLSAALPVWGWDGGGSWCTGGHDEWDGGGEWSNGGRHECVSVDTFAGVVSVETEGNGHTVVQVVEGHVVEDVSEEVGVDFTVILSAASFFGISVVSGWVGRKAKSFVVMGCVEWIVQVSQNVIVLDHDIASFTTVIMVDSDAVFAVVPPLAHTVNVVHFWTSSWFVVAKMTPATVLKDVGESEQIHDVSVISSGSEG